MYFNHSDLEAKVIFSLEYHFIALSGQLVANSWLSEIEKRARNNSVRLAAFAGGDIKSDKQKAEP